MRVLWPDFERRHNAFDFGILQDFISALKAIVHFLQSVQFPPLIRAGNVQSGVHARDGIA